MEPPADIPASSQKPTENEASSIDQPLSKNAQKKLVKAARIAEQKKERRAAEKERKKEKKRILAEKRASGELDGEDDEQSRTRKKRRTGDGPNKPFGAMVVVDLGFDDMMTENEIKSLTSQLAYTYSTNRKAERPFAHLLFTSLNGRTLSRLESMSDAAYKRWANAEWWKESYERLWEGAKETETEGGNTPDGGKLEREVQNEVAGQREESRERNGLEAASAAKESVVYLTADSLEELTELREDETYIIGGLCDHNRYKNLCLNKSRATYIRSARLPIGTYLSELRTRKVLTVNQTFEILLKWIETRDWETALWAVIPKRKFHEGKRRGKGASEKDEEDANDQVDNVSDDAGETRELVINVQALEEVDNDDDKVHVDTRVQNGEGEGQGAVER